jgi:putative DNA primase/helicase
MSSRITLTHTSPILKEGKILEFALYDDRFKSLFRGEYGAGTEISLEAGRNGIIRRLCRFCQIPDDVADIMIDDMLYPPFRCDDEWQRNIDNREWFLPQIRVVLEQMEDRDVWIPPHLRPTQYSLKEDGQAEFFSRYYEYELKYNSSDKNWYEYGAHRWYKARKNKEIQYAIEAAKARIEFGKNLKDVEASKVQVGSGLRALNKSGLSNTIALAKSFDSIASESSDWNSIDDYIQFENGVYNLLEYGFSYGHPKYLINVSTGYDYDSRTSCPIWEKALKNTFEEDTELIDFIQKAAGYTLTTKTTEQVLFILAGSGANGKTTFLNTINACLGDYGKHTQFSTFEKSHTEGASNDLARLQGVRYVYASESNPSKSFAAEKIKSLTGGDPITARFLFQEYFEFHPTFKIWLSVNELPKTDDLSDAFWRRMRIIPFNVNFKKEKDLFIPDLDKLLIGERSGIFNWMIEGLRLYRKEGLTPPNKLIETVKDYEVSQDQIAGFIHACVKSIESGKIEFSKLYHEYETWAQNHGIEDKIRISKVKFSRRFNAKGFSKKKIGGVIYYINIAVDGGVIDELSPY